MLRPDDRRTFLRRSAASLAALAAVPLLRGADDKAPAFKISLAQWSLHRAFFSKDKDKALDPLRFAAIAKKDYGIAAVEYVNQFYASYKKDNAYLKGLKAVADDSGVTSVLIMCDNEGDLGDADAAKRKTAVESHYRWVEWAKTLGCHSIRVNAKSSGTYDEQVERAADGLRQMSEWAAKMGIGVIVENQGGLSSNGAWLAKVMKTVDLKTCGKLPDFGNFRVSATEEYDRYKGVDELMPFAKGVSAKSHDFDDKGEETKTDYRKMMDIVVKKHKYSGYVGIEYEGGKPSESEGIKATKTLLEKILAEMAAK